MALPGGSWTRYIEPFLEHLCISEFAAAVAMAKEELMLGFCFRSSKIYFSADAGERRPLWQMSTHVCEVRGSRQG